MANVQVVKPAKTIIAVNCILIITIFKIYYISDENIVSEFGICANGMPIYKRK